MVNIYQPQEVRIIEVKIETPDVKTFRLKFLNQNNNFSFIPGQFGEYSVFGVGEAPFCIASSPTQKDYIECSVKKVGTVTKALHNLDVGNIIGFRGPYGNGFPIDELYKKNIIFVGGGIGLAPLRSLILYCLDNRENFQDITIIYGARTVNDLVYKEELNQWQGRNDLNIVLTVDPGGESSDWQGKIGFVPQIVKEAIPMANNNTKVIVCGPPIMIKFTISVLQDLQYRPEDIITTLEMKMKCGLGKCGRCNIGNKYVCKDGPVFTYAELLKLPKEY